MDGKPTFSKSNLKNFRSRPAVNASSSSRQASSSGPTAPMKPPSFGRSPGGARPSASALLKELQAKAALLTTLAAPVQTSQKVAPHFSQDRPAVASLPNWPSSTSTQNVISPTAAQVPTSLKNISSQPTSVSMPSTSTATANQSSSMPIVSGVPSSSNPFSSQTVGSHAMLRPRAPSSANQYINVPSSGLSNPATIDHRVIHAAPQVYDARGWVSQMPPPSGDQVTSRLYQLIVPFLASIEHRQTTAVDYLQLSDQRLKELVVEVKNLGNKEKEREKRETDREQRERNTVKALLLLAEKTEGIKKTLANIESVIGVEKFESGSVSMLHRLGKIEMSVEEWLERLRDPKAEGMDVDGNDSILPSTPAAAVSIPIVQHEMAVSPIKPVTPIPKMYTSVQVSTSCSSQDFANTVALCTSCSKEIADTSPKESYAEPRIATSTPDVPITQCTQAEDPISTPTRSMNKRNSDPSPAVQTGLQPVIPIKKAGSVGSFSPVDWHKLLVSLPNAQKTDPPPAIGAFAVDMTPKYKKSYVLPNIPEGTIAALRKEALGDPYPYPLESTLSGDGDASGSAPAIVSIEVAAAGLKAAERMLSPQSMEAEDDHNTGEEEDQLIDDVPAENLNERSPSKSHTSGMTEDENAVMTLVMDDQPPPTSPVVAPPNIDHSEYSISNILPYASRVHLVTPEVKIHDSITEEKTDGDISFAGESLSKLREWYTKTRTETIERKSKEGSHSAASGDQSPTPVVEIVDCVVEENKKKKRRRSPSVISISSDSGVDKVKEVKSQSTPSPFLSHEKQPNTKNSVPVLINKRAEPPLFDLTSESECNSTTPANTVPLTIKRLIATLGDDDVDIVSVKKERKSSTQLPASTSDSLIKVAHNASGIKKAVQPLDSTVSDPPGKVRKSVLLLHKQKGPSAASTRIRKRRIDSDFQRQDERDEDDSDQPPLKRVKLRSRALERTTNASNSSIGSNSKPSSIVKSETPALTPTKRVRDSQPRAASVLWPKIEKPTFEQFIECDICDRWYHVGCVGVHPGDIRLSGSEIYHCPPCEAGIHKIGSESADCSRPKCLRPTVKLAVNEEETFIVEAFVGMKKKSVGGRGLQIQYLVKWFGYGFNESTWESEHEMKLPNSGVFIENFETQAKKEMLDISKCNQEAILLKCAARAGWNAQGIFAGKQV